ncbi:archaetidylserine decarboxylase [Aliikangiella coralliicola]|uniref:Phosphatidylserine decarboxylase proenzyme n=1 Tax=Aliikangiella coralliicola TaxID=2592383 RepID=A0A545UBX8_9GAMM|nr:archaetidylserine decarboxylase [Aliikangiella coralliicola]TQV86972.1 phosphatidylserine decarboxylase [Aliikangiella coralliicola]
MSFTEQLKIISQYLIPQHGISIAAGKLAEVKTEWFKNLFIKKFAAAYNIDMSIAEEPELTNYACFNDFFTRAIKLDSRPIDTDEKSFCSPVDGAMSQFGKIEEGRIIQAKNHHYTALELLGGDEQRAKHFTNGEFCTIYLAPKDYHRIHMPCDGKLTAMSHVPGKLFSVNPLTANNVPNLFARNERVISYFDTEFGQLALVAVGATIVGSIETVWDGTITPPTRKEIRNWKYLDKSITLKKGEEMGRFKLGSTVILLMEKANWQWNNPINTGSDVLLGEKLVTKLDN